LIGMFIDSIAALIVVVPLLLPIAQGNYGIDPFHFGVVVCINLVMGILTPPVGAGLFISATLAKVPPGRIFRALVPFLILLASGLLAVQNPLRAWILRRAQQTGSMSAPEKWAAVPVGMAAIYGGYFGAGLSVIVLAVLGLALDDSLTRLNALNQAIAFSVNIAAMVVFLFLRAGGMAGGSGDGGGRAGGRRIGRPAGRSHPG